MPYFIELPANSHGGTQLPKAVFEATVTETTWTPAARVLEITAPAQMRRWSGVGLDLLGGYVETEGPARMLIPEEWAAIVAGGLERAE